MAWIAIHIVTQNGITLTRGNGRWGHGVDVTLVVVKVLLIVEVTVLIVVTAGLVEMTVI